MTQLSLAYYYSSDPETETHDVCSWFRFAECVAVLNGNWMARSHQHTKADELRKMCLLLISSQSRAHADHMDYGDVSHVEFSVGMNVKST